MPVILFTADNTTGHVWVFPCQSPLWPILTSEYKFYENKGFVLVNNMHSVFVDQIKYTPQISTRFKKLIYPGENLSQQ